MVDPLDTSEDSGPVGPAPPESNLGLLVRARRRRRWYWIALAAVVVVVLIGSAVLNRGASVPEGGPQARQQAVAIDSLLDSSVAGRDYLLAAIDDINACDVTGSTVTDIRDAANARADLAAKIDAADVTDLPSGQRIKAGLQRAVRASREADLAYLQWVLAAGDRCPTQGDKAYEAVRASNSAAQAAKRSLVADWNPVAKRYGLKQRSITII